MLMRRVTNAALAQLDARFSALYEAVGRPSIPPELAAGHAVAVSLFDPLGAAIGRTAGVRHAVRWFVGLMIDEKVFDASTFSKHSDRLLTNEIEQGFLASLLSLRGEGAHKRGAFFGRRDFVRRLEEGDEPGPTKSSADEPYSGEKFRAQPLPGGNAVTFQQPARTMPLPAI